MAERICTDCDQPHYALGLCDMHYRRLRRHGSLDDPRRTTAERFWAKVEPDGDCWIWTAFIGEGGYGRFGFRTDSGKRVTGYAHRVAWQLLGLPLIEGLELDHLCRRRACCNPDHLEQVTPLENMRRAHPGNRLGRGHPGNPRRQQHCQRGHALTEDNLYYRPDGERRCRICRRREKKAYKQRRRARIA